MPVRANTSAGDRGHGERKAVRAFASVLRRRVKIAGRALSALIGTLILGTPVAVPAQTSTYKIEELTAGVGEVEPAADGYRHRSSGYLYPRALGEMPARKSTTYGSADADVYYTLYGGGNGDGWINIFVYPASIGLDDEIENVRQSIVEHASGRAIAPPAEFRAPPTGVEDGWFEASVQGTQIVTGYRIARVGGWFIKARISLPVGAKAEALKRVGDALNVINFAPANLIAPNTAMSGEPTT